VVQGTTTPEEAAAELEQLEAEMAPYSDPVATAELPDRGAEPRRSELSGVRVINQMGSVVVVGDASIQDVGAANLDIQSTIGSVLVSSDQ
jgi:hypothetical protein